MEKKPTDKKPRQPRKKEREKNDSTEESFNNDSEGLNKDISKSGSDNYRATRRKNSKPSSRSKPYPNLNQKVFLIGTVIFGVIAAGLFIGSFFLDNIAMFVFGSIFCLASILVYWFHTKNKNAIKKMDDVANSANNIDESLPFVLKLVLLIAIGSGFLVVLYYLALPTLSFQSTGFIVYLTICMLALGLLVSYIVFKVYLKKSPKKWSLPKLTRNVSVTIIGSVVVFSIIGGLTGAQNFRAKDYAKLMPIQTIEDTQIIDKDFSYEDGDIILPNIDKEISYRQAQIAVGEYGNQYFINKNHLAIQSMTVNGERKLVRAAPLEYSNVIVSLQNNSKGTPGYVLVDAKTSEVTLHTDRRIVYAETAKLNTDLLRHIRLNNLGVFFDNYYFEIDNEYNPYWIVPCYRKKIGLFGGKDPSKVLVIDATTGKISDYSLAEAPEWVDNVVDREVVEKQAIYALKYQKGWINATIGSREGVYKLNDGYNYFVKNGEAYYVSSVTSKDERDQTAIGFLTINLSTKEAKLYKSTGITEGRAMSIAELDDSVKAMHLTATWPCFISVKSMPTYYLTLKNSVKTQKYVFMDQASGEKLAIGDSLEEAYQQYLIAIDQGSELDQVTGTIDRINFIGNSVYFSLTTASEVVYSMPLSLDPRLSLLASGDDLSFTAFGTVSEGGFHEVVEIVGITLKA